MINTTEQYKMVIDDVLNLKKSSESSPASEWIKKVYSMFPNMWRNQHMIIWNEEEFAFFVLQEVKYDTVEISWIQAYPTKSGLGAKAIKTLQDLAQKDNITLQVYPWDKGRISRSKLIKFYKKQGFKSLPDKQNMIWKPIQEYKMLIHELTNEPIQEGDAFDLEVGELLIETVVEKVIEDGIVITLDQKAMSLILEEKEKYTNNIDDLEVMNAKRFATKHYPGLNPEEAFKKFMVRGLMHSKDNDDMHDQQFIEIEHKLKELEKLKNRITKESHVDYGKNPYGKSDNSIESKYRSEIMAALNKHDYEKYEELKKELEEKIKSIVSEEKQGLWANIHAKRKRIKAGSGERMRKPGSKGAPTAQNFKDAAKTSKNEDVNNEENKLYYKKINNETELKEHAIKFANTISLYGVPVSSHNRYYTVCSTIFEACKNIVSESKHINGGRKFISLLRKLDKFDKLNVKVGNKVSIINAQLQGDSVELWGFTTPKTITKIYRDPSQQFIKQFEFNNDPNDVWPKTENVEYQGHHLMYSAFFNDKKSADHALLMLIMQGSDELNIRNHIDNNNMNEAEYQGRKVPLGKPFLTPDGPKKRSVYVKNPKGNVIKVNFGQKGVKIKKNNPSRRRSFRARHKCENPGPKHKARYWSCKFW